MKKLLSAFAFISIFTILLTACAGSDNAASGPNPVHMNDMDFAQKSITIKKGQSITLVNDVSSIHVISNGMWDSNGAPRPKQEAGAPKVELQIGSNDSQAVGPFNTPGTYHLYCTVHPGMNLIVIVQ